MITDKTPFLYAVVRFHPGDPVGKSIYRGPKDSCEIERKDLRRQYPTFTFEVQVDHRASPERDGAKFGFGDGIYGVF